MVDSQPFKILFKLTFFRVHPPMKSLILFYSNGLVIWHSFPDIMHMEVNNGDKSGHFEFDQIKVFVAYPS